LDHPAEAEGNGFSCGEAGCIAYHILIDPRLIMGYRVFEEATTENAIGILERAIGKYGCPKEILTDR
jgi:hypothetical protein